MTRNESLHGRDEFMDFDETALKERFETAVGGVSPDIGALMDGGFQRGADLRRRRRTQVLGATGLSAAAAAAVAYAGVTSGLFDSNATGPASPPDSLVQDIDQPGTTRSLAAAALEHLPRDGVVAAGTMGASPERSTLFASVGVETDQGKVQLDVVATTRVKQWDEQRPCAPGSPNNDVVQCQRSTLDDGGELVVAAERFGAGKGPARYLVRVTVRRDDQLVGVLESLKSNQVASHKDVPIAGWNLPVSVATMQEIVSDPRFGMVTSPEMIAAGEALQNFNEGGMVQTDSGSSGEATVAPVPSATVRPKQPSDGVASTSPPERPGAAHSSSGP